MKKQAFFLVRFAYKLPLKLQRKDHVAASKEPRKREELWTNIWKADVSPKVRMFAVAEAI